MNLIKSSTTSSWLIANLRIWGSVPTILIVLVLYLVLSIRHQHATYGESFAGLGAVSAVSFSVLLGWVRKTEAVRVCYIILYALVIIFEFAGIPKGEQGNMVYVIWIIGSLVLSFGIGWLVSSYIYDNFDDFVSRYYRYRNAKTNQHTTRLTYAFQGFIEASAFSFTAFVALIGFFL